MKKDKLRYTTLSFLSLLFLAVLVSCYQSLYYFNFSVSHNYIVSKVEYADKFWWKLIFYTHIVSASVALLLGFFQFVAYLRNRKKSIHRLFGFTYIISVVFLAAPTSLLLACFPMYELGSFWAFAFKSCSWMVFTILALVYIKRGNYNMHSQWMIRSYAMALTSVTVRLLHGLFESEFGLQHNNNLYISLWLSFVLNLLIAEIIILTRKENENEL